MEIGTQKEESTNNQTPGSEVTPDPGKSEQIKEKLGSEAETTEQPGSAAGTEVTPGENLYAGKFKSDKDLEQAYLEEEKKLTQQAQVISALDSLVETDEQGNLLLDGQGKAILKTQPAQPAEAAAPPASPAEQPERAGAQKQELLDLKNFNFDDKQAVNDLVTKMGFNPDTLNDAFYENPIPTLLKMSAKISEMQSQETTEFVQNYGKNQKVKELETMVKNEYAEISKNEFFKTHEKEIMKIFDAFPEVAVQKNGYVKATKLYISENLDEFADQIKESGMKEFLDNLEDVKKAKIEIPSGAPAEETTVPSAEQIAMANKLGVEPEELKKYAKEAT